MQPYRTLKTALCLRQILAIPAPKGRFFMDTGTSDNGVSAILSQLQNREEKAIAITA